MTHEKNLDTYMDELRNIPEIIQVASSSQVPGDKITNTGFQMEEQERGFALNVNFTNETYLETMGIEMAEGRFFSTEFGADTGKIILNETTVKLLELDDPIGKKLFYNGMGGRPMEVIGIVKDYHWESKHTKIRSHALILLGEVEQQADYLSVRISGANNKKIIKILEEGWDKYVGFIPFDYEFLDDHYDGIYQNETQTRLLLYIFAAIAIFISCLGLFGLASFMAERRTKEIGIRKTNGASTWNILRLLSQDFTKWVLLANIVAWPLIWVGMKKWLENFAYRVDIQLWIFVIAGVLAFVIALATVSFHATRASRQNPGILLRYE